MHPDLLISLTTIYIADRLEDAESVRAGRRARRSKPQPSGGIAAPTGRTATVM